METINPVPDDVVVHEKAKDASGVSLRGNGCSAIESPFNNLSNQSNYGILVPVVENMIINVSEAKANLSKLIDRAFQGEEITIAKNNLPLVDLVPHKAKGERKLGLLRGQIEVSDDFNQESEEINEMFYGRGE